MQGWMTLLGVLSLGLLPTVQARPPANERELGPATRAAGIAEDSGARVALLIGVWDYTHVGRLVAPQHDIAAMEAVLITAGWEVLSLPNPQDRSAIKKAVTAAAREAGEGSTVMVYYAGHAAQQDNTNHLFPAGVKGENCYTYESETVRVGWILAELDKWGVKAKVMVLDACRNNPFPACDRDLRSLIGEEGYTPDGTLLAFSTRKGSTASDGNAKTSPYTTALSQHLATPGLDLTVALAYTARDTKAATSPPQEPWFRSGLDGSLVVTPIPVPDFGDPEPLELEPGELVITVGSGRGDVEIDGTLAWSAQAEFDTRKVSVSPGVHQISVGREKKKVEVRPGGVQEVEFRGARVGTGRAVVWGVDGVFLIGGTAALITGAALEHNKSGSLSESDRTQINTIYATGYGALGIGGALGLGLVMTQTDTEIIVQRRWIW